MFFSTDGKQRNVVSSSIAGQYLLDLVVLQCNTQDMDGSTALCDSKPV